MKRNPLQHHLVMVAVLCCLALVSSCSKDAGLLPQTSNNSSSLSGSGPIDPVDTGIAIPMGGNAFITKRGTYEAITASGLTNWSSKDAVVSTYFKVATTGQLLLALNATVPVGTSTVKITVNGRTFTVTDMTGNANKRYRIGVVNITSPGYIKIDMQGISNSANASFANVSDLIVFGEATYAGVYFARDPMRFNLSRAGAEASLRYTIPNGLNAQWFYNEMTVPTGSDKAGSNFISNGFSGGYAGLQMTIANEKRIVLYVADNNNGPAKLVAKANNASVDATVNTGKLVYLPFNWRAGTSYKLLVQAKNDGNNNTSYAAWIYTPEDGQWKFIASSGIISAENYLTGLYSSVQGTNAENGYMMRKIRLVNQWVLGANKWVELTNATFNGDVTAITKQRMDCKASSEFSAFYLNSGGFFSDNLPLNTNLNRLPTASAPSVDLNTLP